MCNGFLKFTSGATPADFLPASKAAKLLIHVFADLQALVGAQIQDHAFLCLIAFDKTNAVPNELYWLGLYFTDTSELVTLVF